MANESYRIETAAGPVWAKPTSGFHVYVEYGHYHGHQTAEPFTVNRVNWGGSAHMYRWLDRSWNIGNEYSHQDRRTGELANDWERRQSLYVTRYPWRKNDDVSESARRKVWDTIQDAVRLWLASPEGLAALENAHVWYCADERRKRSERIAELKTEILKLQAEIDELEGQ